MHLAKRIAIGAMATVNNGAFCYFVQQEPYCNSECAIGANLQGFISHICASVHFFNSNIKPTFCTHPASHFLHISNMATATNSSHPNSTNPSHSNSTFSETAEVRLVSRWPWPQSDYKLAYVLVSSRIYWQVVNEDASNKPQSLLDFRNADSLEFIRLDRGTWSDVNETVKVDNYEGRLRISVPGLLQGPKHCHSLFLLRNVKLEIIAYKSAHHEVWLNQIYARIVPWKLFPQLVQSYHRHELNWMSSTHEVEQKWSDGCGTILNRMLQKLTIVDELTAHDTAAVETGATLAKLVTSLECVAETTKFVADASKCVAGASTVFHLVRLTTQTVLMCAEVKRGRRVLPVPLRGIFLLLRFVLKNITEIVEDEIDEKFVFDILKEVVSTMDIAETQLLRGRGSEFINSEDVKKVETKIDELRHMVVAVGYLAKEKQSDEEVEHIREELLPYREEVQRIREELPPYREEVQHFRPSVPAFFSGRAKELVALQGILEKCGSAIITQYGGVGKTALMTAFAERAERNEQVPGGVFWVTVEGDVKDAISSLAGLAEKLTQRKMSVEERRHANLVLATLKQGLDERPGRWLLCLDNVDDIKVRGLLGEMWGIAGRNWGNGWIVATSRHGQPHVWSGMRNEQRLALEPLCAEDAMVVLWRYSRSVERGDANDDEVKSKMKELERSDANEYRVLKKLCGDEETYSLGGLPLALVHAGAYIARFECSFAEYLHLLENTNGREGMQDIMNVREEVRRIRELQRSIWTTWKISVEKISEKAYTVLRAMAVLGSAGVGKAIVKGILEAATANGDGVVEEMFRKVILEELMRGSALIWCDEGEGEGECQARRIYKMHRLVRRFVLSDMRRGSALWNEVYSVALGTVHESVETELGKEGKSFTLLPDVFGSNHHEFVAHALALVDNYTLRRPGNDMGHGSKVEDIHQYCGALMRFMGKPRVEVEVWEHLLDILHCREAESRKKSYSARFWDIWYRRSQGNQGKELQCSIAGAYYSQGGAMRRIGELDDAASVLERSLEMYRAIHGYNKAHADIASSLYDLALVYCDQGMLERAAELHEQSLDMRRTLYGAESLHRDIAKSVSNLGCVYQAQGKLEKALQMHEQNLQMYYRAIHGHNKPHPDIARTLNNMADVYYDQGNLVLAAELFEQSVEMLRAMHGAGSVHPDIAVALSNLGRVYQAQAKLDKALKMHERSLEIHRAIHGPNTPHPDIARSLNSIGLVCHEQGKLDRGAESFEQSLEMLGIVYGCSPLHDNVRAVLSNLMEVYEDQGKQDEALAIRERLTDTHFCIGQHNTNRENEHTEEYYRETADCGN